MSDNSHYKYRGVGINATDLPNIFMRFYRADKSRTSHQTTAGHGLGLSIATDIIKKLDGKMIVNSAIDHGSKFTIVF